MRRFISVLILLLLLPSCTPSDSFSAGQPLSRDELASLSAELFTQAGEPDTGTEAADKYTDREPNTVYWTESGSVYHQYRDCYHLRDSKSIKSGTVLTARMAGKEKVCSECGEE
ncbi:MAG: hypothetical protein IJX72_07620 [Clostridia bacterium]|nr:hypothetical protein [Clostridia bacterium]